MFGDDLKEWITSVYMASPNISEGKEASVEYFNNWVEEVKKTVPKERLLVFSVKEGWEPLCKFLNVPVPDCPFPNTNDSAQMKKFIRMNQLKAYTFVFGAPIILGISAYLLYRKQQTVNVLSFFLSKIMKYK